MFQHGQLARLWSPGTSRYPYTPAAVPAAAPYCSPVWSRMLIQFVTGNYSGTRGEITSEHGCQLIDHEVAYSKSHRRNRTDPRFQSPHPWIGSQNPLAEIRFLVEGRPIGWAPCPLYRRSRLPMFSQTDSFTLSITACRSFLVRWYCFGDVHRKCSGGIPVVALEAARGAQLLSAQFRQATTLAKRFAECTAGLPW
jgi:hypothetical protein